MTKKLEKLIVDTLERAFEYGCERHPYAPFKCDELFNMCDVLEKKAKTFDSLSKKYSALKKESAYNERNAAISQKESVKLLNKLERLQNAKHSA